MLVDGKADFAVHSIKDMAAEVLPGFRLAAVCEREDPRDVWISNKFTSLQDASKAVIGTGSPRRKHQLLKHFPECTVRDIRGNVETRLQKCDNEQYDIIILAAAGLKRLDLAHRINGYLDTENFIPAIGQGAIAVECLESCSEVYECLSLINHALSYDCVMAERAVNKVLQGFLLLRMPLALIMA